MKTDHNNSETCACPVTPLAMLCLQSPASLSAEEVARAERHFEEGCPKCIRLMELDCEHGAQKALDATRPESLAPAKAPVQAPTSRAGASAQSSVVPDSVSDAVPLGKPSSLRGLRNLPQAISWALCVLLTLLLSASLTYAIVSRDENQRLKSAEEKKDQELQQVTKEKDRLAKDLEARNLAIPVPLSADDAFKASFQECLNSIAFDIDNSRPDRPQLKVYLSTEIQRPYFDALRVYWDHDQTKNEFEPLYYWRHRPVTPVALHSYQRNHDDPPRKVTVKFVFFASQEAQAVLKVEEKLEKSYHFLFTSRGLQVIPIPNAKKVIARITEPSNPVPANFRLSVFMRAPKEAAAQEGMVHVLLKPMNGNKTWSDSYYLLSPRIRVSDLAKLPQGQTFEAQLRLHEMLGQPLTINAFPTRYKVLVVQMPSRLQGWKLPGDILNLSVPAHRELIVHEQEFDLRRDAVPAPVDLSRR